MDGYRGFAAPDEVIKQLQSLPAHRLVLVLSGGHCPDCHDFVPVFARLAELAAHVDVRIFPRDQHPILAKRFATDGKHYIPTVIVMDSQFHELGRFIERPRILKDLIAAGENPHRRERRGAYQMAAAAEVLNLLFTSI